MRELIVASNPKRRTSAKQRAAARRNIRKAQAALKRAPNPRKRKRRAKGKRRALRRRRNYIAARRMPNPVSRRSLGALGKGLISRQVMPALVGGGGAVANDVLFNFLPLPDMLKTGNFRHVGKAASAVLIGYAAGMVLGRRIGDQLGAGALTVVGYNVVRDLVTRFAPNVSMGMLLEPGLGYAGAGWNPQWGGVNKTMGLDALLPASAGGGGGVSIPSQLTQPRPYAAAPRTWVDETQETY